MSNRHNLLPCPFCGDAEVQMHPYDIAKNGASMPIPGVDAQYAHCDGCGAEGPQAFDLGEAIAAWNRRPAAKLYFAHDACGGETEVFPTEAEALAFAKESVEVATNTANDDGEWEEGASEIYVGVVTHRARLIGRIDGSYDMTFGPLSQNPS